MHDDRLDSSVDGRGGDTLVSGGRRRDGMIATRSQGRGDGTQRRATRCYSELNCCSQLRKVMATTDFLLNCFVLGDNENNVFSVEIAKNKNVSILKDEIKKKKVHL